MSIGDQWQSAYEKAGFYRSGKNTAEFWDAAARSGEVGLSGTEHILLIREYLTEHGLLGKNSTVLDIGCGSGAYVVSFAEICRHVTALDYSAEMLNACRKQCRNKGIDNVSFVCADCTDHHYPDKFDCVLSCLNPSNYNPGALQSMLSTAAECVVYFSMDTPIAGSDNEPIYCGCNSVRYAEKYLGERGYSYAKIPYLYKHRTADGRTREILFAYLVVRI